VKSYSGFLTDFFINSFKIRAISFFMLVPNVRKHGLLIQWQILVVSAKIVFWIFFLPICSYSLSTWEAGVLRSVCWNTYAVKTLEVRHNTRAC